MKRRLLLGAIVPVLGFVAVAAFAQASTATETHVYIAGEVGTTGDNTLPVYWKDGAIVSLKLDATYTNGWTCGITEDTSGNIYVVGGQWNNSGTMYGYWKNSTFTQLTPPATKFFVASDIAVDSGGSVWVVGMGVPALGSGGTPYYWKNGGKPISLAPASTAYGAFADDVGNVYLTGQYGSGHNMIPYLWKNGETPAALSTGGDFAGYASQIALGASGNLYASGCVWNNFGDKPAYWKAVGGIWGEPILLPTGSYSTYVYWGVEGMAVDLLENIDAYSLSIADSVGQYFLPRREGGVVVAGAKLLFWKGASNAPLQASLGGNDYIIERAHMCAVDAKGDFYIAGSLGPAYTKTKPFYWKNGGDPIPLNTSGNPFGEANGIVIGP
jgi:hypothetical protein